MLRTVLVELGLFLTPFILYAALLIATKGSVVPKHWSPQALVALVVVALGLAVAGLFLFEGGRLAPPGSHYVPAETRDGKFVPGHFE